MEKSSGSLAVVAFTAITVLLFLFPPPLHGAGLGDYFTCWIENRMGEEMLFECDGVAPFTLGPGASVQHVHENAPNHGETGSLPCDWSYAGNTMSGVVVWDEKWPEAPSCRDESGRGCSVVFKNKEVTLVSGAGKRRVLGDLAVKECSKNYGGFGGWLPWGLGCSYPKHDHPYVGKIVS